MNKQELLAILSNALDDNTIEEMSADDGSGDMSQGQPMPDMQDPQSDDLQSWNSMQVSLPPANKPQFYDNTQLQQEQPGQQDSSQTPDYAHNQLNDEEEPSGMEYMPMD